MQLVASILYNRGVNHLPALQWGGIVPSAAGGWMGGGGVCVQAEQKGPQSVGAQHEASLMLNWWQGARSRVSGGEGRQDQSLLSLHSCYPSFQGGGLIVIAVGHLPLGMPAVGGKVFPWL